MSHTAAVVGNSLLRGMAAAFPKADNWRELVLEHGDALQAEIASVPNVAQEELSRTVALLAFKSLPKTRIGIVEQQAARWERVASGEVLNRVYAPVPYLPREWERMTGLREPAGLYSLPQYDSRSVAQAVEAQVRDLPDRLLRLLPEYVYVWRLAQLTEARITEAHHVGLGFPKRARELCLEQTARLRAGAQVTEREPLGLG